ncbi:hypothetical protein DLH72_04000 [Candidatus Gracilibacteria bacterium]|nr:MAG: hypothetical protein DLH72_04000 [Candidatus Gracilibacteria bacterium]
MKGEIDFEKITPIEVFKKFPKVRQKMLDLQILKLKNKQTGKDLKFEDLTKIEKENIEIVIPSFKCIRRKKEDKTVIWLPFFHQVFWSLLGKIKDVEFALSELKMYKNNFYTFGNGVEVELDRKNFDF